MSRPLRNILIVAAALIPIGITLTILGFVFGGKTGWSFAFENGKGNVRTEVMTETVDLREFDSLEVDVASVDVSVISGDSYTVEYKTRKGEEPEITEKNGKLVVKQPPKGMVMFDFSMGTDMDHYVITVPKEIKIDLVASSGDIEIDGVEVSGDIKASSGDISLKDLKADKLDIKTSSGKITLSGIKSEKLKCNSSSGDIMITGSEADKVECEASSGEVTVELEGDEDDYSYDIDASSGSRMVNGTEYEDDFRSDAGGDKEIKVKTSSGDIEVSVK